jgi:hypothetical protein
MSPLSDLPTWQIVLGAFALVIALHQVSFMYLFNPTDYKKNVVIRAIYNAFKDPINDDDKSKQLVQYKYILRIRNAALNNAMPVRYHTVWSRLLNIYDLKLRRNAPQLFKELRQKWNIDEEEYSQQVTTVQLVYT